MRWMTTLPKDTDAHKITVFLVPTVALVDQQSEHIANNTSLRVRGYRGDMGESCPYIATHSFCEFQGLNTSSGPPVLLPDVDFWMRDKWIAEFESADCVVMTAEIWRSVLYHAYWPLENVSYLCKFGYHSTEVPYTVAHRSA